MADNLYIARIPMTTTKRVKTGKFDRRQCQYCKGTGISAHWNEDSPSHVGKNCISCDGRGYNDIPETKRVRVNGTVRLEINLERIAAQLGGKAFHGRSGTATVMSRAIVARILDTTEEDI